MDFAPKSRWLRTYRDIGRGPAATLFARVAGAVCDPDGLAGKELDESWQDARRIRCGSRSRRIVELAAAACDTGGLRGFVSIPLAIDTSRVAGLQAAGYDVVTHRIPTEITPHCRRIPGLPQGLRNDRTVPSEARG